MAAPLRIWAVGDERAGVANQVLGLAEAVGGEITFIRARLKAPYHRLPATVLQAAGQLGLGTVEAVPALAPPWPDLLIAAGRPALAASLFLRRSAPKTFRVQLQAPRIRAEAFDLVVAPFHDALAGENVFSILGATHRVSAARLEEARERWRARLAGLPSPRVAVLIGGASRAYRLPADRLLEIARELRALANAGASLMVTASRRTGPRGVAILRESLGQDAFLWDGGGDNPLLGMLAHAEHVLVTEDSTNMIAEAASTGAPVQLIALEGGTTKFRRFHEELLARGIARPFRGQLESWSYRPLHETERAADEIRRRLAARPA